jgi:DinB superfamily
MTREDRRHKLESYGAAPAELARALRQFPKKMWMYKVSPDRWSIHETILHLADNEANAYIICRLMIAEPGAPALAFDPALWAGSLGYFHQSTKEALEIIRRLRRMTYHVLAALPESIWSQHGIINGETPLTLDAWLDKQERHIPMQVTHMSDTFAIWAKTHPPRKLASIRSSSPRSLESRYISLSTSN